MSWLRTVRVLALACGLIALGIVALGSYGRLAATQPLEILGEAPQFRLIDQLGRPVSSDELVGNAVLADFVYTNCPDVCPLLSTRMETLQARLREERLLGTSVQLLSFSVDPARDTPPVLAAYAQRYHADPDSWRFLTGPPSQVVQVVVGGFHYGVEQVPSDASPGSYDVMHGQSFVLIDPQGRVRARYRDDELEPSRVVADLRQILR